MVMHGLISQVRTCGIGWYFVKDDKYHLYTPHEVEEILSNVGRSPSPSGEAQDGDASHHAEPIRGFVEEASWEKTLCQSTGVHMLKIMYIYFCCFFLSLYV